MLKKLILTIAVFALSGCGEWGGDDGPDAPYSAWLLLEVMEDSELESGQVLEAGSIEEFFLGDYNSIVDCANLVEFELAPGDLGKRRWINLTWDYLYVNEVDGLVPVSLFGGECISNRFSEYLEEMDSDSGKPDRDNPGSNDPLGIRQYL